MSILIVSWEDDLASSDVLNPVYAYLTQKSGSGLGFGEPTHGISFEDLLREFSSQKTAVLPETSAIFFLLKEEDREKLGEIQVLLASLNDRDERDEKMNFVRPIFVLCAGLKMQPLTVDQFGQMHVGRDFTLRDLKALALDGGEGTFSSRLRARCRDLLEELALPVTSRKGNVIPFARTLDPIE